MGKSTTGRVDYASEREPDPDQMATDTLMTSVFSGIALIVATFVLGLLGSVGVTVGSRMADGAGAKIGLAIGLAMGMALIGLVLRRNADRLRGRSVNLYRGAWIGSIASLLIIVVMAYLPHLVIPQYCPPGQICTNEQRS
jgi:hypothetical protein